MSMYAEERIIVWNKKKWKETYEEKYNKWQMNNEAKKFGLNAPYY